MHRWWVAACCLLSNRFFIIRGPADEPTFFIELLAWVHWWFKFRIFSEDMLTIIIAYFVIIKYFFISDVCDHVKHHFALYKELVYFICSSVDLTHSSFVRQLAGLQKFSAFADWLAAIRVYFRQLFKRLMRLMRLKVIFRKLLWRHCLGVFHVFVIWVYDEQAWSLL